MRDTTLVGLISALAVLCAVTVPALTKYSAAERLVATQDIHDTQVIAKVDVAQSEQKAETKIKQPQKAKDEDNSRHRNIDPVLTELETAYKKDGAAGAQKFAKENHLQIKDGNKVAVYVPFKNGVTAEQFDSALLSSYGIEVNKMFDAGFYADIPIDRMRDLADSVKSISYIQAERDAEWKKNVKEEIERQQKKKAEREQERIKAGRAQVDPVLLELEEVFSKGGEEEAKKFAGQSRRLIIKDGNKITVYLRLKPGISDERFDRTAFQEYGGEIIDGSTYGSITLLEAYIPIGMISKIAEIKDISDIELPDNIEPQSYNSEGVSLTGAPSYHSSLITGASTTVAVIDLGFEGVSSTITNGDLPSSVVKIDCTGASCVSSTFSSETEVHGTAVAEIVYDMAPKKRMVELIL